MKRRWIASGIASLLLASSASAALVYDNGPFITGSGNGAGGADTSAVETDYSSFGFNANNAAPPAQNGPFWVADNFTVTGGNWDLSDMVLYAYQTGSSTTSSITSAVVAIYDVNPATLGATPIYGDYSFNRLNGAATVWSGVYRVSQATLTATNRPIMAVDIDLNWLPELTNGATYWISVGLTGSIASGPWVVPVTPHREGTDNAYQHAWDPQTSTDLWFQIDGNANVDGIQEQDLAFKLNGVVPEPASMLLLGGLALLIRRR